MLLKLFFASMSVKTNSASMERKAKLPSLVLGRKILTSLSQILQTPDCFPLLFCVTLTHCAKVLDLRHIMLML